jgi:molybdenum cofactor cytidylyltransferase
VQAAGLPGIVVVGHAAQAVRDALAGYRADFVTAVDHAEGMGHSLATGIAAIPPDWQAAIICLGDMPLISPELLRRLARNASPSAILIPTFAGRRGNPLLWGRDHFAALATLRGDVGARALLQRPDAHITTIPWEDDSIFRDFDTPTSLDQHK